MNQAEQEGYLAEFERRWRERTPSQDILSVLPAQRVGRSEMRTWFVAQFGRDLDLDDVLILARPLKKLFGKLRKEFPNERW